MKTIEICFTPQLYESRQTDLQHIAVVIDVLRATTAITTAINYGAKGIIPIKELSDLKKMKENGYLIASERDGLKVDFADFGNSPLSFMDRKEEIDDKVIAYSTTNGTKAIEAAMQHSPTAIVLGAYTNKDKLVEYLLEQNQNVVFICSGWKSQFGIEDAVVAGAFCQQLLQSGKFQNICDSSKAALNLWDIAKDNLILYLENSSHCQRLKKIGLEKDIEFCLTANTTPIVPVYEDGIIKKLK